MNYDEGHADSLSVGHHREIVNRLQLAMAKDGRVAIGIDRCDDLGI